jgi:hypothetical protein
MVVTRAPSTWAAKSRQLRAVPPSTSTVQAPHTPCSQPSACREAQVLAEKVGQRQARGHLALDGAAVDDEPQGMARAAGGGHDGSYIPRASWQSS